jgi:lipid A 4'-phosphatase
MTSPPLNNTVLRNNDSPYPEGIFKNARLCFFGAGCSIIMYLLKSRPFWIPLVFLAVATLIFRLTDADVSLARLFFDDSDKAWGWHRGDQAFWVWLYNYGIYPAWILGAGGLVVWLLAFFWKKIQPIRDEGLFLALMLLLGPGVLVNGISKPYCGRPRPHLTIPFNGKLDFLPVFSLGANLSGDCNSFPSGHASTGFYLMAPAFFFYRRRNGWAVAFLFLGLFAGCLMGIARMAAGAHFASDVIWAGGFVYFTGLILAAIFRFSTRGVKEAA